MTKEQKYLEIFSKIENISTNALKQERELPLEVSKSLVNSYRVFKDILKPKTDVIYYPCSGTDNSASEVFSDSRIIYVDVDPATVKMLKKAGLEVYNQSAMEFNPGQVDVLILLNPAIPREEQRQLGQYLSKKGYLLCNDYHRTATEFKGNPDFKLIGLIRKKDNKYILDQSNLEDYWQNVENDEEFKSNAPSLFEYAKRQVQKRYGITTNILENYLKIREAHRQKSEESKKTFIPLPDPPRKKGNRDDIFVYQKITEQRSKTKE